jgi:mitochondrial-processing peptidase subunit beta
VITPPTRITSLANGLRVATEEGSGSIASIGVYIDAGSRQECDRTNGVAHFLEHMAFKGTKNRSQDQIENEMETMGGHLNAYTSREQTVYNARVFGSDWTKGLDILSDIVQNSVYPEKAIEAERSTIIREAEEVAKISEEVVFDLLHETAYKGSSLGRTILGPTQNINTITREDLTNFVSTHYTTANIVVVGAGAIKHDEFVKAVEKSFIGLPEKPKSGSVPKLEPAIFTGSSLLQHDDDMDDTHVAIAVEAVPWNSADTIVFLVIQNILGSWNRASGVGSNVSSELCRNLAEEHYVHKISTFNTIYKDTALFGNYFVTVPEHIDDAVNAIQNQWMRLCFAPTEEEVARAKNSLKAQCIMVDGSMQVMEDIGRQVLCYGRRLPVHEIFARIDAVDVAAVKRVASTYFYDQDPVIAAVGAGVQHVPDLNWVRGGNTWWRV